MNTHKIRRKCVLYNLIWITFILTNLLAFTYTVSGEEQSTSLDPPHSTDYNYYFEVPEMTTNITLKEDGSIDILYDFTATCYDSTSTQSIDVFDIGAPNFHYDLDSVRAWKDGVEIDSSYIGESEYVDNAVEIWLNGVGFIKPGETANMKVFINNPIMVFKDSEEGFASCLFTQTWFASSFTYGATQRTVRFFYPEGLESLDDVSERIKDGSIRYGTYTEVEENGQFYSQFAYLGSPSVGYEVGVRFPAELTRVYNQFWRITIIELLPVTLFFAFIGGIIGLSIFFSQKQKKKYFPPVISTLGAGPRQDLTPSEAATVLERPLEQVAMLMIFELMKDGHISIQQDTPLRFKVNATTSTMKTLSESQKAIIKGINKKQKQDKQWLQRYPNNRLSEESIDQDELTKALTKHIKKTSTKMKGYSVRKTRNYYKDMVDYAQEQIKYEKPQLANAFLWALTQENYEETLEEEYTDYYYPSWYAHNYYWYSGHRYGRYYDNTNRTQQGNYHRIQPKSGKSVIAPIIVASRRSITSKKSFLRAVQKVTRPASTSSGRSGGGSSCACACACACAGGGR